VDRSVGNKTIPEALRRAGVHVEIHDDHFRKDAPDEEWLARAGEQGWVVLTKDQGIRHRRTELEALLDANVRAFILTSGGVRADEYAKTLVACLPKIRRLLAKTPAPFIARITRSGDVARIEPPI